MTQPNMRIARKIRTANGTLIRTEVGGQWFVQPNEWPNSSKADYIRRQLADFQTEEPAAGWDLETQGTDWCWHTALEAAYRHERHF